MNYVQKFSGFLIVAGIVAACNPSKQTGKTGMITNKSFGTMPDGNEVKAFTLTNINGIEMTVISYGGIITSLKTPDRNGNLADIVLGYDDLQSYLDFNPYFGAIVGRYGNRIARGKFTIDDTEYALAVNNIGNHLHGGIVGFDKVIWEVSPFESDEGVGLKLSYLSRDMEEGYPGNLNVSVTYYLSNENSLEFEYVATTDKKTVVNLTQHSYFNLKGDGDILDHELMLNASKYVPVDSTLIPTGELLPVEDTPFDFTISKKIGQDIDDDHQQIKYGNGFDHCWILNQTEEDINHGATLYEPTTGRVMEVYTTEPGIQFYSGNFLDGTAVGKGKKAYTRRTGLCLETEHFPDSPNQPLFPSTGLNPGEEYRTKTVLKFSVRQ